MKKSEVFARFKAMVTPRTKVFISNGRLYRKIDGACVARSYHACLGYRAVLVVNGEDDFSGNDGSRHEKAADALSNLAKQQGWILVSG